MSLAQRTSRAFSYRGFFPSSFERDAVARTCPGRPLDAAGSGDDDGTGAASKAANDNLESVSL